MPILPALDATLAALGTVAGVLTFGGEALYFWLKSGIDPMRVLTADLTFRLGPRPGWVVLAIALAVPLAAWLRRSVSAPPAIRRAPS